MIDPVLSARYRALWLCTMWAVFVSGTASFAGETQPEKNLPDETAYRRIFVPADSPENWPVGSTRYLPIPASEFEQLVERARRQKAPASSAPVRLSGAVYRAKLLQDDVLGGTAEIAVKLPDSQPRLLPLAPLNLAITSATWQRDASQPASLGIWRRRSLGDSLGVLVQQSDTLILDWQLRARATQASSVDFLLEVPPAVPQTFELVLPTDRTAMLKPSELIGTQPAGVEISSQPIAPTQYLETVVTAVATSLAKSKPGNILPSRTRWPDAGFDATPGCSGIDCQRVAVLAFRRSQDRFGSRRSTNSSVAHGVRYERFDSLCTEASVESPATDRDSWRIATTVRQALAIAFDTCS